MGIRNCSFTCFVIMLVLAACSVPPSPTASEISPPNAYTKAFLPLEPENIKNLHEADSFVVDAKKTPVLGVHYAAATNQILAVFQDGDLVRISVDSGLPMRTLSLGIVSRESLGFSTSGDLVMGVTKQHIGTDDAGMPITYIGPVIIWDTNTGELVECVSGFCGDEQPYASDEFTGALLDPREILVFNYDEFSFRYRYLDREGSVISLVNSPEADYWWRIGRLAYDSVNHRLFIVYREGRIESHGTGDTKGPLVFTPVITKGVEYDLKKITSAKVDPTGNWLAYVRGDQVVVWSISGREKTVADLAVEDVIDVQFDRAGKLLFIVRTDEILVFDLGSNSWLPKILAPGITSMVISEDNRIIVWGDIEGGTHILAVQ